MGTSNNYSVFEKEVHDLEISMIFQRDGHSCVPLCIKMVLDSLSEKYEGVYTLDNDEISDCIGTHEGGTDNNSNLDNINEPLIKCNPSIEFVRDHSYPDWDKIFDDLEAEKPIICWIESIDDSGKPFGHSVVVKGYRNKNVIYNDPLKGEQQMRIEDFLLRWEEMGRFAIRVKVGERSERKITEYIDGVKNE